MIIPPFDAEDDPANVDTGHRTVAGLLSEEQAPAAPPPEKCPWCDRGTWTDSNNQRRRCAYCAGTGAPPNNSRTA